MKKTRKRGLAWLMTLAMMVSLLPMTVWADDGIPVGVYACDYASAYWEGEELQEGYTVAVGGTVSTAGMDERYTDEETGKVYVLAGIYDAEGNFEASNSVEITEENARRWNDGLYILYLPADSNQVGPRSSVDYYDITATIEAFDAEGNSVGYKPLGQINLSTGSKTDIINGLNNDIVAKLSNVREDTDVDLSIDIYKGSHDYEFKGWVSKTSLKEKDVDVSAIETETELSFDLNRNMDMVAVFMEKAKKEESGYVIYKEFDYGELKVTGGDYVYIGDRIVLFEDGDYTVSMDKDTEVAENETLVVFNGTDADIVLDHVHIRRPATSEVSTIAPDGDDDTNVINLILKGENILEGSILSEKHRDFGILLNEEDPGSLSMYSNSVQAGKAVSDSVTGKLMHDDIYAMAGEDEETAALIAKGANQKVSMEDPYIYIAGADSFEYFDFNNDADKFFNSGEIQSYYSGELFDWFEKRMKENGISDMGKLNALKRAELEEWGGSCFGFSAVAAMFHEEEMSLNELHLFDEDAEDLPTTTEPKDDTDVRHLLHYYQTLQMLPEVRGTMRYLSNNGDRQNLLRLAERLAQATDAGTDDPVMFLYFMGSGAGHAVILDGAVRNADGSYTVMVEDNRFFGQELATDVDYRNGRIYGYKLTGQDINPVLEISKDGKKAVMTFEGGWTTADERMFAKYPAFTETLTRYEVITNYEMLKDYFPGEYKAPEENRIPELTVIDKPVFWFEKWDIAIVDPGDGDEEETVPIIDARVDPNPRNWNVIGYDKLNLNPSATVSVDEDLNVVMEYAPATAMAQVEARDQYAAVSPDGEITGKVAYAEGDIYSSIDTEKADAAVFDPEGAVGLTGNAGEFEITVTRKNGDELVRVFGHADGDVAARPTAEGIELIAPAGIYTVTFEGDTEKMVTVVSEGDKVSVSEDGAVEVPEVVPVTPESELPFTDVKADDWFYNAVKYVYENGLMSGTSETTFSPAVTTSRGMITSILWRMEGRPEAAAEVPFADVAKGAYYAEAIAWAAENGIVSGYDADTFGPNDPITREQLASILFRYAQYKGMDAVTMEENLGHFADNADISSYAVSAMNWAAGTGIISGNADGTLNPGGHAQRSHAAQMLMKFANR